jgi:hypothetical protein
VLPGSKAPRRCGRLQARVYAISLPEQFTGRQFTLLATGKDATEKLGELMSGDLRAGDAYCLKGDPGAGKSTWRCVGPTLGARPGLLMLVDVQW